MKVAKKAGVNPDDKDKVIVLKLKIWVSSTEPELTPGQVKEQVKLAWQAIKPTAGFSSAWISVTG